MSDSIQRTTSSFVMPAPANMAELWKFCQTIASSDLVPKDYKNKPENVLTAVQMGSELGLHPMQSVQGISVINGRPAVWGDLMLALVQREPECEDIKETFDAATGTARCEFKRRGRSVYVGEFSLEDAKTAGLLGKQGPWTNYPKRMLKMRARAWALRDGASDWLKGLTSAEEQVDVVEARVVDDGREERRESRMLSANVAPAPESKPAQETSAPAEGVKTSKGFKAAPEVPIKSLTDGQLADFIAYCEERMTAVKQPNHRAALEVLKAAAMKDYERRCAIEAEMAESMDDDYDPETGEVNAQSDDFRDGAAASAG